MIKRVLKAVGVLFAAVVAAGSFALWVMLEIIKIASEPGAM